MLFTITNGYAFKNTCEMLKKYGFDIIWEILPNSLQGIVTNVKNNIFIISSFEIVWREKCDEQLPIQFSTIEHLVHNLGAFSKHGELFIMLDQNVLTVIKTVDDNRIETTFNITRSFNVTDPKIPHVDSHEFSISIVSFTLLLKNIRENQQIHIEPNLLERFVKFRTLISEFKFPMVSESKLPIITDTSPSSISVTTSSTILQMWKKCTGQVKTINFRIPCENTRNVLEIYIQEPSFTIRLISKN
jgi:hypothetical protein